MGTFLFWIMSSSVLSVMSLRGFKVSRSNLIKLIVWLYDL